MPSTFTTGLSWVEGWLERVRFGLDDVAEATQHHFQGWLSRSETLYYFLLVQMRFSDAGARNSWRWATGRTRVR